jgi:hypothetical protein
MGRNWKKIGKSIMSFLNFKTLEIPLMLGAKQAQVKDLTEHRSKAIIKKGSLSIPHPLSRPMLDATWSLEWSMDLIKNTEVSSNTLKQIFEQGGLQVGFGSYRGLYGKFKIVKWEIVE